MTMVPSVHLRIFNEFITNLNSRRPPEPTTFKLLPGSALPIYTPPLPPLFDALRPPRLLATYEPSLTHQDLTLHNLTTSDLSPAQILERSEPSLPPPKRRIKPAHSEPDQELVESSEKPKTPAWASADFEGLSTHSSQKVTPLRQVTTSQWMDSTKCNHVIWDRLPAALPHPLAQVEQFPVGGTINSHANFKYGGPHTNETPRRFFQYPNLHFSKDRHAQFTIDPTQEPVARTLISYIDSYHHKVLLKKTLQHLWVLLFTSLAKCPFTWNGLKA